MGSIRMLVVLALFYVFAVILGLALFLAAIKISLFGGISILFYRGLAVLAATGAVLFLLLVFVLHFPRLSGSLTGRDAIAATVVAVSLNLAAFVLGPVTVDRSVSVFMLSRLADAKSALTADDLRVAFTAQYVREWDQVGRRLKEQIVSGNVEETSDGRFRLTTQGQSFMTTARLISRLFGGDPRFVGGAQPRH